MPPVVVPGTKQGIQVFNGTAPAGAPASLLTGWLFNTMGKGVPRMEDLLTARVFEDTHIISIPMETIKSQVTTTPFMIAPTVENPTKAHWDAAEEIEDFFRGNFNTNRQSLDHLLKQWVTDILSIDAGVLELVPEANGEPWLSEVYARDGTTFTKNPDIHGRMPAPGSTDPAYYQFSLGSGHRPVKAEDAVRELLREGHAHMPHQGPARVTGPIPFTRDQIVWTEENPRTKGVYGFGRVQKTLRLTEILVNADTAHIKTLNANEFPEGILGLPDSSSDELKRFRAYWRSDIAGQHHKMPITNKKPEWIPIRAMLQDLQFLESQQWYHKLVWYTWGLSSSEVGDAGDVNRSTAKEHSSLVWRRTTRPLLDNLAAEIDSEILPFMEAYWRVNGELAWAWDYSNLDVQALEQEIDDKDLRNGTRVVNEVRAKRGEEPLPWGDLPQSLVESVSRMHPEWALQEWGGLSAEEVPAPAFNLFSTRPRKGGGRVPRSAPPAERGATQVQAKQSTDGEVDPDAPSADQPTGVEAVLRDTARRMGLVIENGLEGVLDAVASEWPVPADEDLDQTDSAPVPTGKNILAPVDNILARLSIAAELSAIANDAIRRTMEITIEEHVDELSAELNEQLDDDAPQLSFEVGDVEDTFAYQRLRDQAAEKMRNVEEEVKEQTRNILAGVAETDGNVTEATSALRAAVPELSDNRAALVARTEVGQAQRNSSQAVADSTDAIDRKQWRSARMTGRTRPWHADMHGVTIGKGESWTVPGGYGGPPHYQSSEYPKEVYVVGEDEPYNCLCDQREVLREDLSLEALSRTRGVVRKHAPDYTECPGEAARRVLFRLGLPGELWSQCFKRTSVGLSRSQHAKRLGVGKAQYYSWLDGLGLR